MEFYKEAKYFMRFAIASGKALRYQDAYRIALWDLAAPQAADKDSEGNIWPIDQSAHPTSLSKSPSEVKAVVEASAPLLPQLRLVPQLSLLVTHALKI